MARTSRLDTFWAPVRALPWWWQALIGIGVGSVIAMFMVTVARASSPAQHTCDEPENPCYSAAQMDYYFNHGHTHGFLKLNPKYGFPKAVRVKAIAAHKAWCRTHPTKPYCGSDRTVRQVHGHSCSNWWCSERYGVTCAGGAGNTYWSCPGGYTQAVQAAMTHKLSNTQKVIIGCGGLGLTLILAHTPPVALFWGEVGCGWTMFYGLP
jgi:hypothetical protein